MASSHGVRARGPNRCSGRFGDSWSVSVLQVNKDGQAVGTESDKVTVLHSSVTQQKRSVGGPSSSTTATSKCFLISLQYKPLATLRHGCLGKGCPGSGPNAMSQGVQSSWLPRKVVRMESSQRSGLKVQKTGFRAHSGGVDRGGGERNCGGCAARCRGDGEGPPVGEDPEPGPDPDSDGGGVSSKPGRVSCCAAGPRVLGGGLLSHTLGGGGVCFIGRVVGRLENRS
jgi:hypothetical protein